MDKYENLGLVGEGSYGLVMKCRHRDTGQIVAVKKFIENEDDVTVKKIALREVRMLKKLRHENLVNLIEVFRRRRRLYLVFEFVDHTILDELEQHPNGLDEDKVRQHTWQVLRALDFCHSQNIIHRDIKPENVLVSRLGVVKLCDFGFARMVTNPCESCTDYVATRWYRAPELLVGDTKYGKEVDVWAVGCLFAEMITGEPLFPGESDIDQVFFITSYLGPLMRRHQEALTANPMFSGMKMKSTTREVPSSQKLATSPVLSAEFIKLCLQLDPNDRPTCTQLLNHKYFTCDRFPERFLYELKQKIQQEFRNNPLLKKQLPSSTSFRRTGAQLTEDIWKNRRNKQLAKEQQSEDRYRLRVSENAENTVLSKSSAISMTSKLRLTPPKLVPTKIAPLAPRMHKQPNSPKGEFRLSPDVKDLSPSAIPPIGQSTDFTTTSTNMGVELLSQASPTISQSGMSLFNMLSSAGNLSQPTWLTEKPKKGFQKKGVNQPTPHTATSIGGAGVLNSLLQGERSQLHDKGMLTKRRQRVELGALRLQPVRDDFSLPDVRGSNQLVTGSPIRSMRSHKKTPIAPPIPFLPSHDQNNFQEEPQSPVGNPFDQGLPFV